MNQRLRIGARRRSPHTWKKCWILTDGAVTCAQNMAEGVETPLCLNGGDDRAMSRMPLRAVAEDSNLSDFAQIGMCEQAAGCTTVAPWIFTPCAPAMDLCV